MWTAHPHIQIHPLPSPGGAPGHLLTQVTSHPHRASPRAQTPKQSRGGLRRYLPRAWQVPHLTLKHRGNLGRTPDQGRRGVHSGQKREHKAQAQELPEQIAQERVSKSPAPRTHRSDVCPRTSDTSCPWPFNFYGSSPGFMLRLIHFSKTQFVPRAHDGTALRTILEKRHFELKGSTGGMEFSCLVLLSPPSPPLTREIFVILQNVQEIKETFALSGTRKGVRAP